VKLANVSEAAFHGDEDLLRHMLLNIVDNATKFTPHHGTVRSRTLRTRVRAVLGLAIAKWIARAHDGDIELGNSGETGTKFVVRLPFMNGM
jgi:signal transduction histidine kinase